MNHQIMTCNIICGHHSLDIDANGAADGVNTIASFPEDEIKISTNSNLNGDSTNGNQLFTEDTTIGYQEDVTQSKYVTNISNKVSNPVIKISRWSVTKQSNKNLPANLLQYLNPSNIIRPISQTISSISSSLSNPYQPNNPLSYLNPYYLWKKISDKGQQLLSKPNNAIFGFGQIGLHDYPFPYRSSSAWISNNVNGTNL